MCYTQVYSTQELTGLVNNWNPQMYTTQESSGLVNKLKLSGIHYIYTGIHLRRGILDNVWPTSSTTSKRTWLNTANLTSNSSSRGVSPLSPYLSLWLASIPFPTSPLPLLATGISVRTAWKLTWSPTNRSTAGAWTPIILASPWNGSTGNNTSYWMKTITSDMQAILASTSFLILGTR